MSLKMTRHVLVWWKDCSSATQQKCFIWQISIVITLLIFIQPELGPTKSSSHWCQMLLIRVHCIFELLSLILQSLYFAKIKVIDMTIVSTGTKQERELLFFGSKAYDKAMLTFTKPQTLSVTSSHLLEFKYIYIYLYSNYLADGFCLKWMK